MPRFIYFKDENIFKKLYVGCVLFHVCDHDVLLK